MQLRSLVIPLLLALATGLSGCTGAPASQPAGSSGQEVHTAIQVGVGQVSQPAQSASAPASGPVAGQAQNGCLGCHGPFDKIILASSKFVAPTGEKTSPHRYVPHDSKLEKDIPDCTHCHTAHPLSPLPAKGSIDLSKVSVEWCYTCHHEKNFTSCKECHP